MDPKNSSVIDNSSQTWAVPPAAPLPPSTQPELALIQSTLETSLAWLHGPQAIKGRTAGRSHKLGLKAKDSLTEPMFEWIRGRLIGKGSYGRVYLALNVTIGQLMAVKQVELPKGMDEQPSSQQLAVIQALKFESDTLKDLDHPNIVQYLGFEENLEFLSIFLEYVPGGTIAAILRNNGSLSEEVTKFFLSQILNGLEYLHSRGIIHRDMKSDNILVEPSGACKISDFGISKKVEQATQARAFTSMKGTIFWMAPEALSDSKEGYDAKVDIWSVGCVTLEMWTGSRPWIGEEIVPVMMKLFKHKLSPPLPPGTVLSKSAEHFRQECFNPDPRSRPSAALLRNHPYLILPPDWKFQPDLIINSLSQQRKSSGRIRPSKMSASVIAPGQSEINSKSASIPFSTRAPHYIIKPQLPTLIIPPPKLVVASEAKAIACCPPLVFITPPTTAAEGSATTDWMVSRLSPTVSDTSESHKSSKSSKAIRTLVICNPDSKFEREESLHPYSQTSKKPLPTPITVTPYSARQTLSLPSKRCTQTLGGTTGQQSTRLELVSKRHPNQRAIHFPYKTSTSSSAVADGNAQHIRTIYTNYSADGGTMMWKKRPNDLSNPTSKLIRFAPKRGLNLQSLLSKPRDIRPTHLTLTIPSPSALPPSPPEPVAKVGPRPHVEDVYERLDDYFPNHDLNQAVVEAVPQAPGSQFTGESRLERSQTMKSIRKIAEEQVSRRQTDPKQCRRQTRLWDTRIQELKM